MKQSTSVISDSWSIIIEPAPEAYHIGGKFQVVYNMSRYSLLTIRIIAEKQVSLACLKFAQDLGVHLLERGLVSNFMAHLVNLFEFGFISPSILKESMNIVFELEAGIS